MDHVIRGSHWEVSGFQTIATCRDGLKNSREKSATSPFASPRTSPCLQETRKSATSAKRHSKVGDVAEKSTGTSRVCRGRLGVTGKSA